LLIIKLNHSFSLLVQRKRNQKKGHFFLGIFSLLAKNPQSFTKFFPRLQKTFNAKDWLHWRKRRATIFWIVFNSGYFL